MTSSRTSSAPSAHRRRSRPRGPAHTSREHGGAAQRQRRISGCFLKNMSVKEMLMRTFIIAALVLAAALSAVPLASAQTPAVAAERSASPPGAEASIISPKDGATVKSPVLVQFGLKGMGIAPAGVKFENTGHHHLLVDTEAPTNLAAPLPTTDKIVHFGKGQTETMLTLPPGKHTLQLLLGDMNHVPHDPAVISKKITITVVK